MALSSGVVIGYTHSGKGYLQKFDKTTGAAAWASPVVFNSPVSGLNFTTITELTKLSDDSFVAINIAKGTAWAIYGTLVAQRYDGNGNALWTNASVLTTTQGVQYNVRYDHLEDNDNVYIGYFTSGITGSKFDAFVKKVNSDGALPWGDHGKAVSNGSYMETKTNIGINNNDLWAISTFTNSNQNSRGEFVQKFDKQTGNILLDEGAKELYPLTNGDGSVTHVSTVNFLNSAPVFVSVFTANLSVFPAI